jgi:hypothetical protein
MKKEPQSQPPKYRLYQITLDKKRDNYKNYNIFPGMKQNIYLVRFEELIAVFEVMEIKIPAKGHEIINKMVEINCHSGQQSEKEGKNRFSSNFEGKKTGEKRKSDMN